MPKYHTSIAQWGLVSGIRQDVSDLIVVNPAPSRFTPQARKGQLLIVTEAAGDAAGSREACELVTRVLHETYYEDGVASITSSLRRAMRAANAALYEYNFSAPAHKRSTVGMSCGVLHGADLYLAQVPPAQVYLAHAGKLRAVPNPIGWIGGAQSGPRIGSSGSLGTSMGSEPEFFRSVIQPGDTVVLCSSNVARLLSKAQAEQLICFADALAVAEGLYELCRRASLPEAHAAVIEIMPALSVEAQHAPLSAVGVSEHSKLAAARVGDWIGDMTAEAKLAMAKRPVEGGDAPIVPLATATSDRVDVAEDGPAPAGQNGSGLLQSVPVGELDPLPLSAFLGEGDYGGIVRPPAPKQQRHIDLGDNTGLPIDFKALPRRSTPPPTPLGERATLPVRRLRANVLGRMANASRRKQQPRDDGRVHRPKVRGLTYRRSRPSFPWRQTALLVIGFFGLVVVGLQFNKRHDANKVQNALSSVQQALNAARHAPDDTTAQQQLGIAEQNLKNITPLIASGLITTTKKTTWASYQQLLQDYDGTMASINHIGFLASITTLSTLPAQTAQISRIVLPAAQDHSAAGHDVLYLLDTSSGTVYVQDGQSARPLLRPGDAVGSVQVGQIRDLLWRNDNPLAVERNADPNNPFVLAYLSNGKDQWLANKLPGSEWLPQGREIPIATFGGNLYIWNADARQHYGVPSQLLKYASGQYADVPQPWITAPKPGGMDEVADLAIDGTVYMLHPNGTVSVFEAGVWKRDLPPPKLTKPVASVSRFFVTPDTVDPTSGEVKQAGHIYLLDTQNERVIQIAKADGHVIQQIQSRVRGPLNRLTDLAVDEANGIMYLANGNQLLRTSLPVPPPPAATTATPARTAPPATPVIPATSGKQ